MIYDHNNFIIIKALTYRLYIYGLYFFFLFNNVHDVNRNIYYWINCIQATIMVKIVVFSHVK